ncbi:MAG: DUF1549 domain-containing protein [Aureliella sp.]
MNHPLVRQSIATIAAVVLSIGIFHARFIGAEEPEVKKTLSQRIDHFIDEGLKAEGVEPAELCDDATFLRRVSLDLTGRNPTSGEAVAFLRDERPDKRAALIDRLLESPTCAVHLADVWSAWLLPEMQTIGIPDGREGLHTWLRNRFANNLRYDRLVADLLVASGSTESGAGAFFISLEGKPEKIAAKTARVFLGVQLDCAECHDHPFDHWKQRDFWGFAAYFARLSAEPMAAPGRAPAVVERNEGEVTLPNTDEVVAPRPLVATGLSGLESGTRRQQLTLWLTARENPYLARAAVNRCWSILFGRGLIEPIDDMRSIESASHPALLAELSHEFAAGGFDLRGLLRAIANTRAYQRSSGPSDASAADAASYASMPVKPLTSTQLAACLQQVAREVTGEAAQRQTDFLAQQLGKLRGDSSQATLGIVQALVTLHSNQLAKVHAQNQSRLLQALTAPHLNDEQRIKWLFLSTLCRPPRPEEVEAILQMRDEEKRDEEKSDALPDAKPAESSSKPVAIPAWQADLLWALVNSTEFAMTP